MEPKWLYLSLFSVAVAALLKLLFQSSFSKSKNLPPTPPSARPLFGHLHLLQNPLHRNLHKLSQNYGPVISLHLGFRLAVVASSPSTIEECFTKNDAIFANRPQMTLHRHLGYNFTTLISANYGDHWRNLRRLCSTKIFSPSRLNMYLDTREEETKHLLSNLYKTYSTSGGNANVELRWKICELTFNKITRMVAGKRFYGDIVENKEQANRFQELIGAAFKLSGAANVGDYVPFFRWIDYSGIEKEMSIISKKMDEFLQGLIEERRKLNSDATMIDHLLSLQKEQPGEYSDNIIKGLVSNTLIGGTNTSETAIEWAMSLLLNHPESFKNVRDEIDRNVGFERLVKEEDLSNLKYLHNIVSETFRMFPPLPLIIPHESSADCKLGGYDVPRGTIILANAWAVHRDPQVWEEPDKFKPERFEGKEAEGNCKLMAFGMGRRICPGAGMGEKGVGFALASLIQNFDFETVNGERVDMEEGVGLAMPRANPLVVKCKPRPEMHELLKAMI